VQIATLTQAVRLLMIVISIIAVFREIISTIT
jgi:hypothetical protein